MKPQNYLKKISIIFSSLTIMQMLLMFFITLYIIKDTTTQLDSLIYILMIFIIVNSSLTSIGYYYIAQKSKAIVQDNVKNLEDLNSKLREQRHDYLNHIQVIYGLMELEEYEEASKYIKPVYKDILKLSKALKTSHPAINALLQAKVQIAEDKGVDVFLEIKSSLSQMAIEPWELCKVLANIIDNAIRALEEKEEDKRLYIDISETLSEYRIALINNGPKITSNYQRLIFNEGFTTKKSEGHGMGLSIVRRILDKVGGKVSCQSTDERTLFEIELPKKTVE